MGQVVGLDGDAEGVVGGHGGREAEGAGGEGVDVVVVVGGFRVDVDMGSAVVVLALKEGDEAGDGHCCSDGMDCFDGYQRVVVCDKKKVRVERIRGPVKDTKRLRDFACKTRDVQ